MLIERLLASVTYESRGGHSIYRDIERFSFRRPGEFRPQSRNVDRVHDRAETGRLFRHGVPFQDAEAAQGEDLQGGPTCAGVFLGEKAVMHIPYPDGWIDEIVLVQPGTSSG